MAEVVELIGSSTTSEQKLWLDEYAKVAAMRRNAADFVSDLVFVSADECAVVCIDERVQPVSGPFAKMTLWRLPGSGILLGSNWKDSLQKAAAMLRGKVSIITWHRACGAAAEAKKRFGLKGNVDSIAKKFAMELSELLGIRFREIVIASGLSLKLHTARGVVYDGTGLYHASNTMPQMFVVSRKLIDDTAVSLDNLVMSHGIAVGHGFGDKFKEQAFQIVVLAETEKQLPKLLSEVESQLPHLDNSEVHGVVMAA